MPGARSRQVCSGTQVTAPVSTLEPNACFTVAGSAAFINTTHLPSDGADRHAFGKVTIRRFGDVHDGEQANSSTEQARIEFLSRNRLGRWVRSSTKGD